MSNVMTHAEVHESVQDLLEAAEAQGQGDDLVVTLLRESIALVKKRQPHGGALSDEQVAYLFESGAFTPSEFADIEGRVAKGALAEAERKTRLKAVAETMSADEVALWLGIDASRVRHRQAKGGLYGFLSGGKRRYPAWQFTNDSTQPVLPGLATLVKAFPGDIHPASIQGFMTTPQADLRANSEPMTPVEWLLHGGDPQTLVSILDSFLQS